MTTPARDDRAAARVKAERLRAALRDRTGSGDVTAKAFERTEVRPDDGEASMLAVVQQAADAGDRTARAWLRGRVSVGVGEGDGVRIIGVFGPRKTRAR
ncbi:MAG: hypothetical protein K2X87_05290 [Gemmataceae bacterium]|nr:hypothetical protein [Gemmataceae bacterium]